MSWWDEREQNGEGGVHREPVFRNMRNLEENQKHKHAPRLGMTENTNLCFDFLDAYLEELKREDV